MYNDIFKEIFIAALSEFKKFEKVNYLMPINMVEWLH